MLALALSESDGPMAIIAFMTDNSIITGMFTKEQIGILSNKESVKFVKIGTRLKNRRKGASRLQR